MSVPILERHVIWNRRPSPCLAFSFPCCVILDTVLINLSGFEEDELRENGSVHTCAWLSTEVLDLSLEAYFMRGVVWMKT